MLQPPSVNADAELLSYLGNTHVFVVGDLILDRYIEGTVSRISPEAPVPVVLEKNRRDVLGGAGNVAANVAAFGGRATLAGVLGQDLDSECFKKICAESNIDTQPILLSKDAPTTRKTRVIAGYQQVVRIDHEAPIVLSPEQEKTICKEFEKFTKSKGPKAMVISDYGKGVLTKNLLQDLISAARKANIPVVTDPKSLDMARYAGSTIIKPNLSEGRALLRALDTSYETRSFDSEVLDIAEAVIKTSKADCVILSLSDKGVIGYGPKLNKVIKFASQALQVADVSGAGDTMIAFLAMGCAAGLTLEKSMQIANTAAGVVCGKLGTATVSESELLGAMMDTHLFDTRSKVVPRDELRLLLEEQKKAGKKIVFTNGCFDLLHPGHVVFLQKCRSFGQALVVGLNSDDSVRKLKGPTRPIQTFLDRAHILSGLSCVDYVCEFSEDTPLNLIKTLQPDVVAKGADYTKDKIVGAKEVESWGGKVEIVELVDGKSTSTLEKKIKG